MNKARQHDHATADDGDDGTSVVTKKRIEVPPKPDDRQLQHDEPEAAGQQEEGHFFFGFSSRYKIRRRAGKEYEGRCTKMRDPPGEEQTGRGARKILRAVEKRIEVEQIAHMVYGHDDHDNPPQQIDRFDPIGPTGVFQCCQIFPVSGIFQCRHKIKVIKQDVNPRTTGAPG